MRSRGRSRSAEGVFGTAILLVLALPVVGNSSGQINREDRVQIAVLCNSVVGRLSGNTRDVDLAGRKALCSYAEQRYRLIRMNTDLAPIRIRRQVLGEIGDQSAIDEACYNNPNQCIRASDERVKIDINFIERIMCALVGVSWLCPVQPGV